MKQLTNESKSKEGSLITAEKIERALIRAAKEARRIARFHGTPIHIIEDGKIIAIKP